MVHSKLIDLLRSFSNREWKAFRDFVDSPYFNKNEEVVRLCEYLSTLAPDFTDLTREKTHQALFPKLPTDEARLNHTMSFLLKLGEQFLVVESLENNNLIGDTQLLNAFIDRDLDKHYTHHIAKVNKRTAETTILDVDYFHGKYVIEKIESIRFLRTSSRVFNQNYQNASDSLDAFYLLEKMRLTCYMLMSQTIVATPYNLSFTEEACRFIGHHVGRLATPAIEAYYRIFRLLTHDKADEDFQLLKQLIQQHNAVISTNDLQDIYEYMINFCNLQIMKVREQYVVEAFDLYTGGIKTGMLLEKGHLSPWHFKNIIKLALRLKKFDFTEQFIREHTHLMEPQFRVDAEHYNLAELYYHTGRLSESMMRLNQVEFTDVYYSLGAKVMLCKIYHETGDFDALESLLHAFNTYLRRNKLISEDVRKAYINFISLLRKIRTAYTSKYPEIRAEIGQTALLTEKNWLLKIIG